MGLRVEQTASGIVLKATGWPAQRAASCPVRSEGDLAMWQRNVAVDQKWCSIAARQTAAGAEEMQDGQL
jgi:hypothetical protein